MLDGISKFIFSNILAFLHTITNLFFSPFLKALSTILPDSDFVFNTVSTFFTEYVFPGAHFFKMVFINLTGLNNSVFLLLLTIIGFRLAGFFILQVIQFALNIWRTFQGSKTGK